LVLSGAGSHRRIYQLNLGLAIDVPLSEAIDASWTQGMSVIAIKRSLPRKTNYLHRDEQLRARFAAAHRTLERNFNATVSGMDERYA
jgi:hypothetical protein